MTDAPELATEADFPIDPALYADQEVAATFRALGMWWALTVEGLDPRLLTPLLHEQVKVLHDALGDVVDPEDPSPAPPLSAIAALAADLDFRALGRERSDLVLGRSLALLRRAGRALATAGELPTASGSVHGLFRSDGGVPKLACEQVEIGTRGVVGDVQRSRQHHGRPWQALCLWSKEQVDRLRDEGNPIGYGYAGENISATGIDWALIRPGTRLQIGAEVLAEITLPALPCAKNAQWFVGHDFNRMHHEREAGISRMYASVLRTGTVAHGDHVTLEPL